MPHREPTLNLTADRNPSTSILIGVGGGGCSAVHRMVASWGREGLAVVGVNSDREALAACSELRAVEIGRSVTRGLGTGGDLEAAKLAAQEGKEALWSLVNGAEVVVLVAGLGGGVGTAVTPILARMAREAGALSLCFVTLPFAFEGERRSRQAEEGLRAIRKYADVVIGLPNEHLLKSKNDRQDVVGAFRRADEVLGTGIRSLFKILGHTGVINLDLADVRTMVKEGGGLCTFGYAEAEGENRADRVVLQALQHPLMEQGAILARSPSVLVNILGGPDLTLNETQNVMTHLQSTAQPGAHLCMGVSVEDEWEGRIALILLVGTGRPHAAPAAPPAPDAPGSAADRPEPPAVPAPAPPPPGPPGRKEAGRARPKQAELDLASADRGRFKNVEPTVYDGEDLDVPTFIRRGIRISSEGRG